jgi:integrase
VPPVGVERIEEFIDQMWGTAARGTRAKNISIFKSFFQWAYERDRIAGNPMLTIKRPRKRQPDRRRQAHEPRQVDAIVRAQHHTRDRAAILLMAKLGLRKDELRNLKVGDIDLRDGVIHFVQKGGDRVTHPISPFPDVVGELEAHITLDGRRANEFLLYPRWERTIGTKRVVYREDKHRPLSPRGMHEWWTKRLLEAGVEHFPMHELRHTAGTEFHRASKDLKKTQMFMQHKSINATADTYLHLDREDLEEGMRLAYLR